MNTSGKKFLEILIGISALLLIIASLGDLQISKMVMDQNSIFGNLFQIFGMFPSALIPFISAEIIFIYGLRQDNQLTKWILAISGLGFAYWSAWGWVDGWMFYGVTTLNNIKNHQPLGAANNSIGATATYSFGLEALFTFIILVIGTFLIYRWLSKKTYEELSQLIIVAIAGIAVVYVSNSIVNTMKVNWGRFRPYEVKEIVSSTKGTFTNWWHLNGQTGHQSFPSGHTIAAAAALFLPFFADRKNIKGQKILAYSGFVFTLLMMAARVRIGAHFLSDTTMSLIIASLVTFVATKAIGYSFIEEEFLK